MDLILNTFAGSGKFHSKHRSFSFLKLKFRLANISKLFYHQMFDKISWP